MSVLNDFVLFICGDVVHAVWLSVPHSIAGPSSDTVTTEELTRPVPTTLSGPSAAQSAGELV